MLCLQYKLQLHFTASSLEHCTCLHVTVNCNFRWLLLHGASLQHRTGLYTIARTLLEPYSVANCVGALTSHFCVIASW